MKTVFVVTHEYFWCNHDVLKIVGVYATRAEAEDAVSRTRLLPGFCDWPDDFSVDEYELGQDTETAGFATMVNILVPSKDPLKPYVGATTSWRPGDLYEICTLDDEISPDVCRFAVGDIVRCKEQDVEGTGRALIAVELAEANLPNSSGGKQR
jgi:hypothetical protein